jgi:hypothetical protein
LENGKTLEFWKSSSEETKRKEKTVQLLSNEKSSSKNMIEEEKTVQSISNSIKKPIENSEKIKVQEKLINITIIDSKKPKVPTNNQSQSTDDEDFFAKKHKVNQSNKTDVTKLIQRPQLETSSDDFDEEEEEEEEDNTYNNIQVTSKAPIKSLPMIEKKKRSRYSESDEEEEEEEMSPEEQNETFRIEIPKI